MPLQVLHIFWSYFLVIFASFPIFFASISAELSHCTVIFKTPLNFTNPRIPAGLVLLLWVAWNLRLTHGATVHIKISFGRTDFNGILPISGLCDYILIPCTLPLIFGA